MDYAELKQTIIDYSHRSDLSSLVDTFIEQGESLWRRQLFSDLNNGGSKGYGANTTTNTGVGTFVSLQLFNQVTSVTLIDERTGSDIPDYPLQPVTTEWLSAAAALCPQIEDWRWYAPTRQFENGSGQDFGLSPVINQFTPVQAFHIGPVFESIAFYNFSLKGFILPQRIATATFPDIAYAVLQAQPNLYIYSALVNLYRYTRDNDQAQYYWEMLFALLDTINIGDPARGGSKKEQVAA